MPGNKFLVEDKSQLLKKKLERLTSTLSGSLGNETLQTQEAYLFETIKILTEFYRDLQEPQLTEELINQVRADDIPDADLYNKIWDEVLNDLTATFAELENVENFTVSNFNFITTESNRLTARLKAVDSKLGDYILYSLNPSKDIFFFKDSFNDLSKVAVNSPLLNATECEVNQAEGIVTLPVNREEQSFVVIKESPLVNPSSNGTAGNNQELGAPYNGNLVVLLDNNPDTWFEYERVVLRTADDQDALVLDLTINVGEEKVINHIRVNPNNFGTKTTIEIDDIETSLDGQVYTSIKDDIPIAGFTTQDEENIFSLAPSTSKFAGQGLYTFTPRKIKYVHFIFKQSEPYLIQTPSGERLRYAIGLRDIDIRCFAYENKGELVSLPFESTREITKVQIETNQNPTDISELARIQFYVSPDDGATFYELQPKDFQGPSGVNAVPEILNFNNGDASQITTPVAVKAIRLKTVFTREDDQFAEGSSYLNKTIQTAAELHSVPNASPFKLPLQKPPVDGTVQVIDPLFGSRGVPESQYIIGHAQDRLDTRRYRLPFTNFPRPKKKVLNGSTYELQEVPASEWIHVEVGGEEWTHSTVPLDTLTIDFDNLGISKLFTFNVNNGVLEFGDSLTTSLAPADNQPVSVYFEPERLFPASTDDDHSAPLDFPTSSNKDDFLIKRFGQVTNETETFPRKATVIKLAQQNVLSTADIGRALNAQSMDLTPKTFLNGRDELLDAGDWSIDTDEGIVYTFTPTSAIEDASATYTYQPIASLNTSEWDWATANLLRDSVRIKDAAWVTESIEDESLPTTANLKILDLSQLSVTKDTLELSVTVSGLSLSTDNASHPFVKEVDFINGAEELGGQFKRTVEKIPNDLVPVSNVATFQLKENISTLTTDHILSFTNTVLFATEVGITPAAPGEYKVDRVAASPTYGQIDFYTIVIAKPGSVYYYYSSSNFSENGLYSVDYKLGRIFTQRPINTTAIGSFLISANFQFTDYRAYYRIARFMDLDSFEVDITNKTVTILDKEVLKNLTLPHATLDNRAPLYLVNYDFVSETREDITSLKTKFSPVLKDYALRLITKGKVV